MNDKPRRDTGLLQITDRDISALNWIAEQYCLCFDQLRHLLAYLTPAAIKDPNAVAVSTARNAVERWLQLGYIDLPHKIIREHNTYIWLSRKGIRELELPYSYYTPKPSTIKHLYAVNAVRLFLQRFELSANWIAQRAIRLQAQHTALPDAELQARNIPIVAVQVLERHRLTSPAMVRDELLTLTSLAEHYDRLWYFLHPEIVPIMRYALQTLTQELQQQVVLYDLNARELPPNQET